MKLRSFNNKKKKKFNSRELSTPRHLRKAKLLRDKSNKRGKVSSDDSEGGDWASSDVDDLKGRIAVQKLTSGANRPPELWMKDGEKKRIRFRDDGLIAHFMQYSLKSGGKFGTYTAPFKGKKDLFAKTGKKPSLKVLFEIIDITGYRDQKTGKRVRNIPRFLKVSGKFYEQIAAFQEKYGTLRNREYEISRAGEGTRTTYNLVPEDRSKTPPEQLAPERLKKKWKTFYAPPTAQAQRAILGGVTDEDEEDNDTTPF